MKPQPVPGGIAGAAPAATADGKPPRARIDSQTLFAAGREVVIAHGGALYRLQLTRQNKLILTK